MTINIAIVVGLVVAIVAFILGMEDVKAILLFHGVGFVTEIILSEIRDTRALKEYQKTLK